MATVRHVWPNEIGAPEPVRIQQITSAPLVRTVALRPTTTAMRTRSIGTDSETPDVLFTADQARSRGMVYNGSGDTLYVCGNDEGPWLPVPAGQWYDHGSVGVLFAYMDTTASSFVVADELYGS